MELQIAYKSDPLWVQYEEQVQFEDEFVQAAFLLIEDDILKGQVVIYYNPFHYIEGESCICIGNVTVPDETQIFEEIHEMSIKIAKRLDAKYIISPMDGSTWNNYRFVTEQNKAPFLLETTSESYLVDQFKHLGYKTLASYFSQETTVLVENWEKYASRYQVFLEQGMCFDAFDLTKPEDEFRALAKFCNLSFRKNFLFSPTDEEVFISKMMRVLPFLNPSYTIIARMKGKVAGFIFAYQDVYNQDEKSIVVKTMARDIDKPYGGLGGILAALVMKNAIRDGFLHCIHALMIDHNASTRISDTFLGSIMSRYELLYYKI